MIGDDEMRLGRTLPRFVHETTTVKGTTPSAALVAGTRQMHAVDSLVRVQIAVFGG